MLRMKLSDLTYEILERVVKIYDKTVGGHGSRLLHPGCLDDIKKELQRGRYVEYRFGSKVTAHSKLWIICEFLHKQGPAIYFSFGPNIDSRYEDEKLAKKLKTKFEKAINAFLKEENLAI